MYALFEEAGKFLAGRVLSEAEASVQVELDSGKRVKVKSAHLLVRFDKPAPAEFIARAQAIAQGIELELAWEFAPEGEFGFADLARDYFSAGAGLEQQAAALLRLFDAPHYFRRMGRGQFRKAPEETVKAALAAIERKRQLAAQVDAWAGELAAGTCPATPAAGGARSEVFVGLDLAARRVLILGTRYAGEIKKSIFSFLNWWLPSQVVLPMHCSATVGAAGDTALYFRLSGTASTSKAAAMPRPSTSTPRQSRKSTAPPTPSGPWWKTWSMTPTRWFWISTMTA